MLYVIMLFLTGPAGMWDGGWITLAATLVTADDVRAWSYSVGTLVKLVAFLGSAAGADLAGSVSFVEVLILY